MELAAGEAVLHQVKDTGTLLAENETQVIIPLGKLAAIGFKVKWDEKGFELASPEGDLVDVELEAGSYCGRSGRSGVDRGPGKGGQPAGEILFCW